MNFKYYEVVLQTNNQYSHTYRIKAFGSEQATILAQAEAIKNGRGYKLLYNKELSQRI